MSTALELQIYRELGAISGRNFKTSESPTRFLQEYCPTVYKLIEDTLLEEAAIWSAHKLKGTIPLARSQLRPFIIEELGHALYNVPLATLRSANCSDTAEILIDHMPVLLTVIGETP